MTITFQRATKAQLKARLAIDGPTGSGKTWTSLEVARGLAGDDGRIVLIDSERGSGALYSDEFAYDYFRFEPPYDPAKLTEVVRAAETQGYDVIVVDSLSHFWEGEGGTLDIVDAAAQRSHGNTYAGWKVGTPALRHLIDALLGLDAHLIVTMRSKMEYLLTENDKGKQVPTKVGMAPVMRAGVEYEFQLVGDMDLEHRMVITKSRCKVLADQVIQPNRAPDMAETFKKWLGSGEPVATREQVDKVLAVFGGIEEAEARKSAKALFADAFGKPDHLLASQFDAALAFAEELAGPQDELEVDDAEHSTDDPRDDDPATDKQLELIRGAHIRIVTIRDLLERHVDNLHDLTFGEATRVMRAVQEGAIEEAPTTH